MDLEIKAGATVYFDKSGRFEGVEGTLSGRALDNGNINTTPLCHVVMTVGQNRAPYRMLFYPDDNYNIKLLGYRKGEVQIVIGNLCTDSSKKFTASGQEFRFSSNGDFIE
jgi:hypothetical protein